MPEDSIDLSSEIAAKMFEQTERLTSEQRAILQSTFHCLEKNLVLNGLNVLLGLFSEHPNYKHIWRAFSSIPDSSLMSAPELRKHAGVFMNGIRTIIHAMDDDAQMSRQLRRIARAHLKWHIRREHILNMLPFVLRVVETECFDPSMSDDKMEAIRNSWRTLYDVIANLVDIHRSL